METIAAPRSRARVLHAFASRDFRLLWTGQTVSLIGDTALLVLVGGALADRYDRRTLMLVSDASRFVLIGALALVDGTGHLTLGILLAIAVGHGLATGFFTPALGGFVPLVVEEPGLGSANALIGMARQGSLLVGPSLAGLLYGFAGSTVVFGFNAASFLVS